MEKIATAFHETFPLRRPSLAQVLELSIMAARSGADRKNLRFDQLYSQSTLGTNEVKAMRRYAYGTGLLDANENPTAFGRTVYEHDPNFSSTQTQWIMHYNFVAPHKCGPLFWNHIVTQKFALGNQLSPDDIADEIGHFVTRDGGRGLAPRTINSTATIFLGFYSKNDALGSLGLLSSAGGGLYVVNEFDPPTCEVFAYVLADYWDGIWQRRTTVNLREVTEVGGPASLLMLGSGEASMLLDQMQGAGLIEVLRRVPPYQVVRLWKETNSLLERLYA